MAAAQVPSREDASRPTIVGVIAVTIVAAVLGLFDLGDQQLRIDEATSWFIAHQDWSGVWDSVSGSEANSGIYYALLHIWLAFGDSEFMIRALSVVFGVATIPVLYVLGARLFGAVPTAIGSVLLAVNAFFVANIQDARGYALATFLVSAASLLFVDVLWRPRRGRTIAYVAVGTLAVYAHFFSALVLGAHALSAFIAGRRPLPVRHLVAAFTAIAVLIVPLIVFTVANDVGQIDWIPELSWTRFGTGLHDLTGGAASIPGAIFGVALLAAIGVAIKNRGERSFERWRYVFIVLWALTPVVFAVVVSFAKPIFQARYLMSTLPALALAVAAAVAFLRGRLVLVGAIAIAVVVAASGFALASWYGEPGERWAERVHALAGEERREEGMLFYAPTVLRPYLYYA